MNNATIFTYYAEDHDRLDRIFQQYQAGKSQDAAAAWTSFEQFVTGLQRHIAWEEQLLFPSFEQRTGMRGYGPTEVMRSEHRQILNALGLISASLQAGSTDTDHLDRELLAILGPHNQKEEQVLYPAIDSLLADPERKTVFERMGAA
jgi:regulator of cell morphogenesis and NO signaling